MPDIGGDKLRGHLDGMVLSVLERGGPAHGLEILRRLRAAGDGSLRLKEGSLYPALYRLERGGRVKAEWEQETKGRRGARRRIYRLTARGLAALARDRADWREFARVIGGIVGGTA
jgi:PadR family transcriptional regulator, regulatory protein PadR